MDPKPLRRKLLKWYQENKRDLPWRRTHDPYAIWVSEIMLQQTQVATVLPYYQKFLTRFPTPAALAKASEEEVLAHWAGLGYYRRAKLLHRGAQEISAHFGAQLPSEVAELKKIPGIGAYTAGAIASIAFGRPSALVDGNVVRVFARLFALPGHAKEASLHKKVWELAGEILDPHHPGDFNQALMELGATVCRAPRPLCTACPLAKSCAACQLGKAETFPQSAPAPETLVLNRSVALCERGDKILLVQRHQARWFQGLWGLPYQWSEQKPLDPKALDQTLGKDLGLQFEPRLALPVTRHTITHHRITSWAWRGKARGKLKPAGDYQRAEFFSPEEIANSALPNFDRKVLRAARILEK